MTVKYFHSKAQCNFGRHLRYEMNNHSKSFNVIIYKLNIILMFLGKISKILEVPFFSPKNIWKICRGCQAKLAAESLE